MIRLDGNAEVTSGRTSTLEHNGDNVASIRILDGPQYGNLTVNPDNTMALVLTGTEQTATSRSAIR